MSEATIVRDIMRQVNKLPDCKAIKIHGSGFQEAGTPDILISAGGRLVFLEAKTATGVVSALQTHRLKQWAKTGAVAEVVRSVSEAMDFVEGARQTSRLSDFRNGSGRQA